jgi:hypothetical protein
MPLALVLFVLAAEPADLAPDDLSTELDSQRRAGWMASGGVVWAPIGLAHGLVIGAFLPHRPGADTTSRLALAGAVGTLAGIGAGMMLGWLAHQGSWGAKWSILIPAAAEVLLIVCVGTYLGR